MALQGIFMMALLEAIAEQIAIRQGIVARKHTLSNASETVRRSRLSARGTGPFARHTTGHILEGILVRVWKTYRERG